MYKEKDDNAPFSTADAPKDPKPGPDSKPTGTRTVTVPESGAETRLWDHVITYPDLPPKPQSSSSQEGYRKDGKK